MRKRLLNNYPQKLLALLIAVGVWWYVHAAHHPRFQTAAAVPVKYVNLQLGYALEDSPREIELRLSGDPGMVAAVSPDKLSAEVNLEGLGAGRHSLPVKVENQTPAFLSRRARMVDVTLRRLNRAKKEVKVGFFGSLRSGLVLGSENYEPREVYVYGSKQDVGRVQYVRANIDLSPHSESFVEEAPLAPLGPDGIRVQGVKVHPEEVRVEVGIRNEGNRVVPIVLKLKKEAGALPGRLQKEMYPSVISLVGAENVLERYDSVETEPFDWRRCREGGIFPVTLKIPPDVTSSVHSINLSCSVSRVSQREFTVPVKAVNLKEGMAAELGPPAIKVVLRGSEQALSNVSQKEISASVDVLGLEEGTNLIAPSVSLPDEYEGVEVTTEVEGIEVNIRKK
ncbi:MAG: CdaR family protein [bacterium]